MERQADGSTAVVLDEYVKPAAAVTDYKTAVSGIEAHHLEAATHTLSHAQDKLLSLVRVDDVLVGHSLCSDLKVSKFAWRSKARPWRVRACACCCCVLTY